MAHHLPADRRISETLLKRIYLDYAATTPVAPEVAKAMRPWLESEFGNPSSLHYEGRRARQAIDEARERLSDRLGCLFAEVLFTSSGTEAANLALIGSALAGKRRKRILLGATEHHCVLNTQPLLERLGYQVEHIPVDRHGAVDIVWLSENVDDQVLLISVQHANNELGTLQPIREVSLIARRVGAMLHLDAVQTLGTRFFNSKVLDQLRVDLATFSAHKIYGPKGVGAIYIRAGTRLSPLSLGGGQEREMRAGTENVVGIVGFGEAVRLPIADPRDARDAFLDHLNTMRFVPTVPDRDMTLDGHAHVLQPGKDAETTLIRLDRAGVSASSGAACSSGSLEASHVLLACGYSPKEAKEGLRFTFGSGSTIDEAIKAAEILNS